MCNEKGLDSAVADRIGEFVRLNGSVELVDQMLQGELGTNPNAKKGLEDLKLLLNYCSLLKIDKHISFDLSLARGLDYYTGVIYETIFTGENIECGSIAAGGRYDDLVKLLSDNHKHHVPCVGISIGIERILSIYEDKIAANENLSQTQCYIASAGKKMAEERMKLLVELWDANIKAEHSLKNNPKALDQFQYCEERDIPYAIVIGEDEIKRGVVKLRDIKTRQQVCHSN